MGTVVGVLHDQLWKEICDGLLSWSAYYRALPYAGRPLPPLAKHIKIRLSKIEKGVRVIFCPYLGFVIFDTADLRSQDVLEKVVRLDEIESAHISSEFRIIAPVDGYEEVTTLTESIPMWHHELIGIDQLHKQGIKGDGVLVAVLDSGVDLQTPYLSQKITAHATFFDRGDPIIGGPMDDPFRHGTHVCGIIAGREIGVAPASSLVVGRIAPDGTTSFGRIIQSLEWLCSDFPEIRVINMSVGKLGDPPQEMLKLVRRLYENNKLLICAIGNDGEGATRTPGNVPQVIGVGAVDIHKQVASFSGGMTWSEEGHTIWKPDIVMPGVAIPSCVPGGIIVTASGTSQAAPMASGLAALLIQSSPTMSAEQLREALINLCIDLPVPPDRDGHGLPDASRLERNPV